MRDASFVDAGFDARRSAQWRAYRYTIVNRAVPDPFLARTAWWVPEPLDLSLLRLGADPFLGEHDFATFCRKRPGGASTTRRVLESRWLDLGDGVLRYDITRHRVLLADGAVDRRHARRRRRGRRSDRASSSASCARATATRQEGSRRT